MGRKQFLTNFTQVPTASPLMVPHFCKLHCECTVKECGDQRAQFTVVLYILEELDFTCRLWIFSFLLICIDQQGEFLLYSMID